MSTATKPAVKAVDNTENFEVWLWSSVEGKWFRNYWRMERASLDASLKELAADYYLTDVLRLTWTNVDLVGATLYNCDVTVEEEDYNTGRLREASMRLVVIVNKMLKAREFLKIRKGIQDVVRAGILKSY